MNILFNLIFGGIALISLLWLALAFWVGLEGVLHQDENTNRWLEEHPDAHLLRGHGGRGY